MSSNIAPVVTRFAPSPTGYLHIGSARTALFNYLYAKKNNGKFLLRIEDTDRTRSTQAAVDALLNGLKWLHIDWDGEEIYQSKGEEKHRKAALKLIEKGMAYFCYTPQEEVDALRVLAAKKKENFIFKSPWRDIDPKDHPQDIKPVVRLKVPFSGATIIDDQLQGKVKIDNETIDDLVLLRSDGTPTYMLAVVVDDHEMGITHIIRGDDHLSNAARQILIYQAFSWPLPIMIHIPLIHGPDGAKLSKRHGALGVEAYQEMGYLPEALNNYLLRLGWGHKDKEIISRSEAIELFDLEGLGKAPSCLDFAKMKFLNSQYIREEKDDILFKLILPILEKDNLISEIEKNRIMQGMNGMKQHVHLITELAQLGEIYLAKPITFNQTAQQVLQNMNVDLIQQVITNLNSLEVFTKENIQNQLKTIAIDNNLKLGQLMQPVRILMTGLVSAPSIFEVMAIIGKEETIGRLKVRQ